MLDFIACLLILKSSNVFVNGFEIWISVQDSLQASMPSLHASKAQESVGGRSPAFQNISLASRVQGTPDTSELTRILPQKYRRRQMSDEEIEYIQVSFFL